MEGLTRKLVSIIIPVYNEEDNVEVCYERLSIFLENMTGYSFEIVFTDNHSEDGTFRILQKLARTDRRVRVFRFAKNIGYQRSILTGYLKSQGDAVIQLDVDLQDPIELIPEFLRKWEDGFAVVYGVRSRRSEGYFLNNLRRMYYRLVSALGEEKIPLDAGDFRLCDRKVIDALKGYRFDFPYLRGVIAGMGFDQIGIQYTRAARSKGVSKFSYFDYVTFAINSLFAQSFLPLRLASLLCGCIFLGGSAAALAYLVGYLSFGSHWPAGFATLVTLLLLGFALVSLFIGILGEYLGRCLRILEGRNGAIIEQEL
jgi:dolichol-phosphate mannosyltransferase